MENLEQIEKFTGDNFTPEKFVNDALLGKSFAFNAKNERLQDVKNISLSTENSYKKTSEQFVDVLLSNYETFVNIGKYVDRIDKSIGNAMTDQKVYSDLIQSLRKDVEEFSLSYSKYLKDTSDTDLNYQKNVENKVYMFEPVDEIDVIEKEFDMEKFLNPQKGDKKWIEEQPEKLRVLIDEKKFEECVALVTDIRSCDLGQVDYETKVHLDETYNYLIEKITLSIGRCSTSDEVKFYLEKMKQLGCSSLAVDTFLNWLSNKLRGKIQKRVSGEKEIKIKAKPSALNVIKEEEEDENDAKKEQPDIANKIIQIISDYYASLGKYMKLTYTYFNLDSNVAYSTYILPWLKIEILAMNKQLEQLYTQIKTIDEMKMIMNFLSKLFENLNEQGQSGKFIYDMYFINNLKIALEAIITSCMKAQNDGVPFDLKRYEISFDSSGNRKLIFHSVAEIGKGLYNISMLIKEFLEKFVANKSQFIGIVFLEEFLFDSVLTREFLEYIKTKISKSMSNNYDVKPFGDNTESIASSNQILINYGITILSIERILVFFQKEISSNPNVNDSTKESLLYVKNQIIEEKNKYFSNLLKVKNESYFYRFYDTQKAALSSDIAEHFHEPEHVFVVFFQLLKNLSKMIKTRIVDDTSSEEYVKFFILHNQYLNFVKIVLNLKNLNEIYDTDFNLSQLGVAGVETIIHGIFFVYYAVSKILKFEDKSFKEQTEKYVIEFVKEWGQLKNMSSETIINKMKDYEQNVIKYIDENKGELTTK